MTSYTTMTEIRNHYEVQDTGNPRMPYILKGKRGATYGLMRQVNDDGTPNMDGLMFAMNPNSSRCPRLQPHGSEWVRE